MKSTHHNILRGIGSVIEIMPPERKIDYSRFVSRMTPMERMQKSFEMVGDSLRKAIGEYANDKKEISPIGKIPGCPCRGE